MAALTPQELRSSPKDTPDGSDEMVLQLKDSCLRYYAALKRILNQAEQLESTGGQNSRSFHNSGDVICLSNSSLWKTVTHWAQKAFRRREWKHIQTLINHKKTTNQTIFYFRSGNTSSACLSHTFTQKPTKARLYKVFCASSHQPSKETKIQMFHSCGTQSTVCNGRQNCVYQGLTKLNFSYKN